MSSPLSFAAGAAYNPQGVQPDTKPELVFNKAQIFTADKVAKEAMKAQRDAQEEFELPGSSGSLPASRVSSASDSSSVEGSSEEGSSEEGSAVDGKGSAVEKDAEPAKPWISGKATLLGLGLLGAGAAAYYGLGCPGTTAFEGLKDLPGYGALNQENFDAAYNGTATFFQNMKEGVAGYWNGLDFSWIKMPSFGSGEPVVPSFNNTDTQCIPF